MESRSFTVRPLALDERAIALALVGRVFDRFEAPEYALEGVETFQSFLKNADQVNALTFYGAFSADLLIGVLATRGSSHIALFFVDTAYQGLGAGRALFAAAAAACDCDQMTVNSSPYAVEIYRRLGFVPLSGEQVVDGIRFTPMKCVLEKEIETK